MFARGDRVYVDDPALEMLRDLMKSYGHDPAPNHYGTVEEDWGDSVLIYFDDGVGAPYPSEDVHFLLEEE